MSYNHLKKAKKKKFERFNILYLLLQTLQQVLFQPVLF